MQPICTIDGFDGRSLHALKKPQRRWTLWNIEHISQCVYHIYIERDYNRTIDRKDVQYILRVPSVMLASYKGQNAPHDCL